MNFLKVGGTLEGVRVRSLPEVVGKGGGNGSLKSWHMVSHKVVKRGLIKTLDLRLCK